MNDDREVAGGTPAPEAGGTPAPESAGPPPKPSGPPVVGTPPLGASDPDTPVPPAANAPADGPVADTPAAGTPSAGTPSADTPPAAAPAAGTPAKPAHTPAADAHAATGTPAAGTADMPPPGTASAHLPPAGMPAPGIPGPGATIPAGPPPPAPPTVGMYAMPYAPPTAFRRRRRPSSLVVTAVITAVLAGGIGGGVGAYVADRDNGPSSSGVSASIPPVDPASLNRSPESVAGIAAAALPGTVTIKTTGGQSGQGSQGSQEGTGAGFVLDDQGHILTNNHVVSLAAGGGSLSVTFSDGTTVPGRIVGRAQGYDLAVVKVDGVKNLKPLPLGNTDEVAVGDAVIAIGSPFGLDGTVTTGIVSAKDRPVASGDAQQTSYMNALQTDASINPGNSGGPLLDAKGRVIGVNSAIRSTGSSSPFGGSDAGSIGLGFAIPINQAQWVAETLIRTGKPVYAFMGIIPNSRYGGTGAQIVPTAQNGTDPVTAGGPADQAGLRPGDVITKLGDRPITGYQELFSEIWSHRPGEKVTITYVRDGRTATTDVTLGQREGDQ